MKPKKGVLPIVIVAILLVSGYLFAIVSSATYKYPDRNEHVVNIYVHNTERLQGYTFGQISGSIPEGYEVADWEWKNNQFPGDCFIKYRIIHDDDYKFGLRCNVDSSHDGYYDGGRFVVYFSSTTCNEGWLSEYRTVGSWIQRKYLNEDCTEEWRDWKNCDYERPMSQYRCNGDNLEERIGVYGPPPSGLSDCELESSYWRVREHCEYGCENSQCVDEPPVCTEYVLGYDCEGKDIVEVRQLQDCSIQRNIVDSCPSYPVVYKCKGNSVYRYRGQYVCEVQTITPVDLFSIYPPDLVRTGYEYYDDRARELYCKYNEDLGAGELEEEFVRQCPEHFECVENSDGTVSCQEVPYCGNGVCDADENYMTCPSDCEAPPTTTTIPPSTTTTIPDSPPGDDSGSGDSNQTHPSQPPGDSQDQFPGGLVIVAGGALLIGGMIGMLWGRLI